MSKEKICPIKYSWVWQSSFNWNQKSICLMDDNWSRHSANCKETVLRWKICCLLNTNSSQWEQNVFGVMKDYKGEIYLYIKDEVKIWSRERWGVLDDRVVDYGKGLSTYCTQVKNIKVKWAAKYELLYLQWLHLC